MGDPIVTSGYGGGSPPGSSQPLAAAGSPMMLARQPLPKQLTAAIKSCTSVERLAQLTAEYQAVLNPIHIAAIITKLPKLDGAVGSSADMGWLLPAVPAQQQQLRQLLQQLLSQLKAQGCKDHSPRGVANIVWALAKLQCAPDAELHALLLDQFCEQLSTAVPQDISNIMWGVAKLTKEHAPVLSTASSSTQQLPAGTAAGGVTSSGSPMLQLGAGLQDSSSPTGMAAGTAAAEGARPLLRQEQVRLLLQHLCKQLHTASVQTISNSLWAVVVLQQEHQWCMCDCLPEVQTLLSVFCSQTQQAMPGHIQPIIRCMAQLATTCSGHAGNSWLQWQPPLLQRLLDFLASQRQQLEMHHVSSVLRDVAQIVCLHLQLQKHARDKQQGGDRTPTGYSSASSLPSMGDAGGAGSVEGTSPGLERSGLGGTSASSSTASSSSMLGPNLLSQSAAASKATADDVEEVLARLASSGGPQDASSTVLALTMLRPQLQQLGLQSGVSALCSMLPPAALPHLGPDVGQRLLAAASQPEVSAGWSPTSAQLSGRASSGEEGSNSPFSLPVSSVFAARVFAQSSEGLPVVPIPLAVPGSVSSSSSGSNAASPTDPSPLHRFSVVSPTAGGLLQATGEVRSLAGNSPTAAGQQPGSNPGSPLIAANPDNPGGSHNRALHAASPAAPAAMAAVPALGREAEVGMDSQEEAAARQLTHNIAYADSVFQLADIFTAHASVMDMIHITACITRLSKVLGTSPSQASQAAAASLLPLLGSKLLAVLPHANARGIANVLWGYGRLRALPQVQLLPPLVEAFLKQLPNAACRDSAVVLWSLARLSEGHGEPAETTVPPELLRRLGREVLQQLATAAQDAPAHGSSGQQQRPPGTHSTAAGDPTRRDGHDDVGGPPSSRDVSNSLMALARLGFVPEDDSAATAGAAALAGQMQGLSVTASGPAGVAPEGSRQLTLLLSLVKAVVEYLLRMSATAKTLDLQETATALKQLGLRELHAKVAATVVTHHGSAHPGSGAGSMQFMQYGAAGSRLNYQGRPMGPQGPIYGSSQYSSMLQQRRQGMAGAGPVYGGGGGWVPAHQQAHGQYEGGMMLRQAGPGGSYMSARQGPAGQVMRQPGMVQQQQQGYMMSASPTGVVQPGGRQSMTGYSTLAGASGGVQSMAYGGSPVAGPGAYAMQYGGEQQQQQQQPPGLLQQQAGGAYASGVQYVFMPQQVPQQGAGTYFMQQQGQQQQGGDYIPVLQQQVVAEAAPPGLVGGPGGAAAGGQQQYYMHASGSQGIMPTGQEVTGGSSQQLFLQPAQVGATPGLGSMGQFGGAGVYQGGSTMLAADPMTTAAYNASVVGDMFLGGQPQQPQSARSQLQLLQQQVGQPAGLYQQQGQMQGFQVQDPGAVYLQQPQQQSPQQLPMMYGQAQQQPQQQQFGAQQGGVGTFVLDPTTGLYRVQQ